MYLLVVLSIGNAQTIYDSLGSYDRTTDFISHPKESVSKQTNYPQIQSDVTLNSHFTGTPIYYLLTPGTSSNGFLTGHNVYHDDIFLQKFNTTYGVTNTGVIKAVDVMFGYKKGLSTSSVTIAIWDDNAGKPGNILGQKKIFFSDIDTLGINLTRVTFTTPVNIPNNKIFYAGVMIYYPTGGGAVNNLTCVMTTTDGDFPNAQTYSLVRYSDGSFQTVGASVPGGTGLKIAFGIFPIVDFALGMDELSANGLMLGQNSPNPVNGSTAINYEITKKENVVIAVYDVIGNKVMEIREGDKQAGQHTINIDVSTFSAGIYYYTLRAGNNSLTKKMIVME